MTIWDVNQILMLKKPADMKAALEEKGFRREEEGACEFLLQEISHTAQKRENAVEIDLTDNRKLCGRFYQNCSAYDGASFVLIALYVIRECFPSIPIPVRFALFTDAPRNERLIREIHSICLCDRCRAPIVQKELIYYDGQRVCDACLTIKIREELRVVLKDDYEEWEKQMDENREFLRQDLEVSREENEPWWF